MTDKLTKITILRSVKKSRNKNIAYISPSPHADSLHKQIKAGKKKEAQILAKRILTNDKAHGERTLLVDAVNIASKQKTVKEAKAILLEKLGISLNEYLAKIKRDKFPEKTWDVYLARMILSKLESSDEILGQTLKSLEFLKLIKTRTNDKTPPTLSELKKIQIIIKKDFFESRETQTTTPQESYSSYEKQHQKFMKEYNQLSSTIDEFKKSWKVHNFNGKVRKKVTPIRATTRSTTNARKLSTANKKTEIVEDAQNFMDVKKWPARYKATTFSVLTKLRKEINSLKPTEAIDTLEQKRSQLAKTYLTSLSKNQAIYISRKPEMIIIIEDHPEAVLSSPLNRLELKPAPKPKIPKKPPMKGCPHNRGIRAIGIADHYVLEDQTVGYKYGDIAHVENIVKSEMKVRKFTSTKSNETFVLEETESSSETTEDLQTSDRFELQKSVGEIAKTDTKFSAGVQADYNGGFVSVSADISFAYGKSTEQSKEEATSIAKEIINRSTKKLQEKTRKQKTARSVVTTTDHNEHNFNNAAGDGHIVASYFWLNKVKKVSLVKKGKRLMLELMVPEPGRYVRNLETTQAEGFTTPPPPKPKIAGLNLHPKHINEQVWDIMQTRYNIQEDPGPVPQKSINVSFSGTEQASSEVKNMGFSKVIGMFEIPEGYKLKTWKGVLTWVDEKNRAGFARINMAGNTFPNLKLTNMEGNIPIAVDGWAMSAAFSISAVCECKQYTLQAWQQKAHRAIINAYNRTYSEWEEKKAQYEIQAGVQISGSNPIRNKKVIKEELQRQCIEMITDYHSIWKIGNSTHYNESFNANINENKFNHPKISINEALKEGKYVRFLQTAIDWEDMNYICYPYFYANEAMWDELHPLDGADSDYVDFIRAGYSRVLLPVNPQFSEAVMHYLYTCQLPNGLEHPTVDHPLYISVIDELRENQDRDPEALPGCDSTNGSPDCVEDEWNVELPTDLVALKEDGEIPFIE